MMRKVLLSVLLVIALCSQGFSEEMKSAVDPTSIGVGARPLGMGNAFTALADDSNSIFLNPAGLIMISGWQMTSMYSKLLNEVNYTLLGFAHSFSREAFGIGYLRSDIGGSKIISYRDPYTGRIVPTDEGLIGYSSSVIYLTYAASLRRFLDFGFLNNINAGLSAKIFNQEIRGGEFEALASGFDIDLGVQYRPNRWLSLGLLGRNILPASSGGVLRWTSGIEETLPSSIWAGVAARVLGFNGLWQYLDQEVYLTFDIESHVTEYPSTAQIGVEWWPIQYFALRLGIDQDSVAEGDKLATDNNITAGVAVFFRGVQFDYAYHQFGDYSENATHFFSLTIGIDRPTRVEEKVEEKPEVKPEEKPAEEQKKVLKTRYLYDIYPTREAIIYDEVFPIRGTVESEVATIKVGELTFATKGGAFSFDLPVRKMGKNAFLLEALNAAGRKLDEARVKVLRLPSFSDVPAYSWAHDAISMIAAIDLVKGYPDGTFSPQGNITRAELTAMLVRASGEKLPLVTESKVFKDVTSAHWAASFIKVGVLKGMVTGYPDGTFKPGANVSRAEGVVVIARFAGIKEAKVIFEKPFPDLPQSHWAIKIISAAKSEGLLEYLTGQNFDPKRGLTRAEAVEILSRTGFAKEKLRELLDFGTGY